MIFHETISGFEAGRLKNIAASQTFLNIDSCAELTTGIIYALS